MDEWKVIFTQLLADSGFFQTLYDAERTKSKGDRCRMKDNVNHPTHYKSGKYECIDVMRDILTDEQMTGFCLGNALKYLWRAGKKNDFTKDIYKAIWYLNYLTGAQSEDDVE